MSFKIHTAIQILETVYGKQTGYSRNSGMEQVIATVLSQRTNYQDEKMAYDNMFTRFRKRICSKNIRQ